MESQNTGSLIRRNLTKPRQTQQMLAVRWGLTEHWAFIALAAASVLLLAVVSRGATFFHDELMFIADRSFADPASWLPAHNEHIVVLHAAVYTALLAVFGTTTYLPFLLTLWLVDIAFAAGIYALVDRRVGRGPALASAALVLFLGSGYDNLFWAFQMGYVGGAALALWGLLVIRTRPALACGLLLAGVLTQGTALVLFPAAVLYGRSRRAFLAVAIPAALYAVWFLTVGHPAVRGDAPTFPDALAFLVGGVVQSAAGATGLGLAGMLVFAIALVFAARAPDRQAAMVGLVALVTEFVILGVGRQGFNAPNDPHYVYLGAAFLVPVFATAWAGMPKVVRPAAAVFAVYAIAWNMALVVQWGRDWPALIAR